MIPIHKFLFLFATATLLTAEMSFASGNLFQALPKMPEAGRQQGVSWPLEEELADDTLNFSNAVIPVLESVELTRNQNFTLSGAPGETVTLNLQNFILTGHSTFTLEGSATTTFIINITNQFSLSQKACIVLSGGVTCYNVFFNVLGPGSPLVLKGQSYLPGTLTAIQRKVRMRGQAVVYGWVISSKTRIRQQAQIIDPPVVSP